MSEEVREDRKNEQLLERLRKEATSDILHGLGD